MNFCENFIRKIESQYPDLLTTSQLIEVGIFPSNQSATSARKRNDCPPFIKFSSRRIVYPKSGVIEWIKSKNQTQ